MCVRTASQPLFAIYLCTLLTAIPATRGVASGIGTRSHSERSTYVDEKTDAVVTRLTSAPAKDDKIYQTHPNWISDGTHIVYVPYYMPQTHPKFARDDDFFVRESFGYLKLVNPQLTDADRLDSAVGRLQYAQPLCPPGFAAMLPDIVTPIRGLQIADTSSYYPEDRGIAESARVAQEMAARVGA